MSLLILIIQQVRLSKREKILIEWQKQTELSHIIDGNIVIGLIFIYFDIVD